MPRILVLATGGTISSRSDRAGGARAADTGDSIVAAAGVADGGVEVEARDVLMANSFDFGLHELEEIVRAVRAGLSRPEIDGIVITHGTDTAEETVALLDLVHDDPRPVVLTGAQRGADQRDTDGPRNLRDAIATAAAPESRGMGVLVVFSGEVFSAVGLRKHHTIAPQPFTNVHGGPLGRIVDARPRFAFRPLRQDPLPPPGTAFSARRIEMVVCYPGADGGLLRAAADAGAHGVIVLASGSGNPGTETVGAIAEAVRAGVVVGLGSRTGSGPVQPIYGGGGAVDAVSAGAIPLGGLPATQARILLALLLDSLPSDRAAAELRRRAQASAPAHVPV